MNIPRIDDTSLSTETAVLPAEIRNRLGELLMAAYEGSEVFTAPRPAHIEALVARLERAFATLGAREEEVFRRDFLEMTPRLRRFAMSLAKDPSAADDLVQDTLFRAWRSRASFEPGSNLGAWLFTIMRNAFYSSHRKRSLDLCEFDADASERMASLPEQHGHLDLQDVKAALDQLAGTMREALVLVAIDNLSYEEAASVMQCRIGTVKSRVWRAREQLAAILGYKSEEIGADGMMLSVLAGSKTASL